MKKPGSKSGNVGRSLSLAAVGDRSSGLTRGSKTTEWFVTFGSNNSLDKSGSSVTSAGNVVGNGKVELREEVSACLRLAHV